MKFPGGRTAAISYTFDDGTVDHVQLARPMLRRHGIRATFYVIPGLVKEKRRCAEWQNENGRGTTKRMLASWADLGGLTGEGHEIANHSMTHKRLWLVEDETARDTEIVGALKMLNDRLGGEPRSWAWPFMKHHPRALSLVQDIHEGTRSIPGTHLWTERLGPERANRWVDKAIHYGGWWFMCIHEIGSTGCKTHQQVLEDNLRYAESRQPEVWIAPVREVAAWMREHA